MPGMAFDDPVVAESRTGGRGHIHGGKHGNEWLFQCYSQRVLGLFPQYLIRQVVEQGGMPVGNPDALLFLSGAPGIGAAGRH